MGASTIATYVILDFVLGIMLVWLYAAVRLVNVIIAANVGAMVYKEEATPV